MYSDPELQLVSRPVPDLERLDRSQQTQRHPTYFSCVQVSVSNRKSGNNHVCIPDGLDLDKQK